jgi:long-chain acyl-CoA synthetase
VTLSYDEAVGQLTAPGAIFEIEDLSINDIVYRSFIHAPTTLKDVFQTARTKGDQTFLVYEDERWSFADVMGHVDGLAAALVNRYGVKKGDRVAIAMRNLPEWPIAFAAVLSIGAISVSLNAWWTEDELDYALRDCGASVLVCDPERQARCAATCKDLGVHTIVVRSDGDIDGADRYADVVDPSAPDPGIEVLPEDDATILYTSGTTGRPKGAVSTHRAITQSLFAFGCRAAVDSLRGSTAKKSATDATYPPTFILIVPLFHVTGCVPVMLSCFYAGMKLVMMHKWDPDAALELIEKERVTHFVGVPTQSWDLLESPRFKEFDTSSLQSVGGGGAPAPPALVHRVDDTFSSGRPNIGYGMTETNAYGPGNSGEDYLSHPTSAGRVVPILEMAVRDGNDVTLASGELGEIWFKGPNLIRGYWEKPVETAETIVDGWLRTGDLGRIDAEGFVYVEDRAKDMILRAGENVYSAEVEAAIYEHPAVYEAAVFGLPHERLGEEVAAVVVLKPGQSLSAEELQAHVASRLAKFKVPTRIFFQQDRLPRGATGKILKREIKSSLV